MEHDAPLTAAEAGAIIGVSARTVTRRAEAGELAFIRKLPGPNGDYLFSASACHQYLADHAEVAAPASP
jgi:hypothetical protein